jgi:hypothetical protein
VVRPLIVGAGVGVRMCPVVVVMMVGVGVTMPVLVRMGRAVVRQDRMQSFRTEQRQGRIEAGDAPGEGTSGEFGMDR